MCSAPASKSPEKRDPLLLSHSGCITWTALGIFSLLASANALLHRSNSKLLADGGPDYSNLDLPNLLALAIPIILVVHAFFLYFTRLHAHARKLARLSPAFPPPFAMEWSTSLAVGIGRKLVHCLLILPTLVACILCFVLFSQPIYDRKSGLQVAEKFESVYRLDLLTRAITGKADLRLSGTKGPSFFPVVLPSIYFVILTWNIYATAAIFRSHRGRIGLVAEYPSKNKAS